MALISKSKPKTTSGGYLRLFGDKQLAVLISKIQSAVISGGVELEKIITAKAKVIDNLDSFLKNNNHKATPYLAAKRQIKKSILKTTTEPDFLVFKNKNCYIIELKDGDSFDTKKSSGEKKSMEDFKNRNGSKINYTMSIHFCCFNQDQKEKILTGFKSQITQAEALTGKEFCDLLNINYGEIVNLRKKYQPENLDYFISELQKIPSIMDSLCKKQK